jgi:hypothetical protein
VEPSPQLLRPLIGLLYQHLTIVMKILELSVEKNCWQEKPKYAEESCRCVPLSTTNPNDLARAPARPRLPVCQQIRNVCAYLDSFRKNMLPPPHPGDSL